MIKKQILIVEIDATVNSILCNCLFDNSYNVHSVKSELEAFEYCQNNQPAMVLIDLDSESIDGKALCRKIKEFMSGHSPSVIFLSDNSTEQALVSSFDSGCDDFVSKPFTNTLLCKKIDALFRFGDIVADLTRI